MISVEFSDAPDRHGLHRQGVIRSTGPCRIEFTVTETNAVVLFLYEGATDDTDQEPEEIVSLVDAPAP